MTGRPSRSGIRQPVALALFTLLGWLVSPNALAQPAPALNLRWEAPVGCPQQNDVQARIRKLAGSASSSAGPLQADGTITQTDGGRFQLKLVMRSGNLVGEREIESQSCKDLAGAAAVTLALLMRSEEPFSEHDLGDHPISDAPTGSTEPSSSDSSAAGNPKQAEPAKSDAGEVRSSTSNPATAPVAPADDPAKPPIAPANRRWHLALQAPVAALSFGPLPKPSWGVALAAGASYDNWRFSLGGAKWQRQSVPAGDFPGFGADVDRLTATLRACPTQRFSVVELAPCLALSLEHASARGTGTHLASRSEQASWLALGGAAQARLYLAPWFSLVVGVDALLEASRPQISIDGVGNVAKLGPAAFTVMVGPEWIL